MTASTNPPAEDSDAYRHMREFLTETLSYENRYGGFGFDPPAATTVLGRDDRPGETHGRYVSYGVANLLTTATDSAHGLRILISSEEGAPVMSLWALTRSLLEASSSALWILSGSSASTRLARAMRIHHHDLDELQKWSAEAGTTTPVAKEMRELREDVERTGLEATKIFAKFNYGDTVAAAGSTVGLSRNEAFALWRQTAAFAHGRTWPTRFLTRHSAIYYRPGGTYSMTATLSINHHGPVWDLVTKVFRQAVREFQSRSQG